MKLLHEHFLNTLGTKYVRKRQPPRWLKENGGLMPQIQNTTR